MISVFRLVRDLDLKVWYLLRGRYSLWIIYYLVGSYGIEFLGVEFEILVFSVVSFCLKIRLLVCLVGGIVGGLMDGFLGGLFLGGFKGGFGCRDFLVGISIDK